MPEVQIYQPRVAAKRYYTASSELQSQIIAMQMPALQQLAQAMASAVSRHRGILLFGSGHSRLIATCDKLS